MLKGRAVTKEQQKFHDDLCHHIGCISCRLDGLFYENGVKAR